MDFTECCETVKSKLTIHELWVKLGLPGEPKRINKSPFRADKSPSLSIYENGKRWRDWGTGEGGDVFDFWEVATGLSKSDAFKELCQMCNVTPDGSKGHKEFLRTAKLGPRKVIKNEYHPESIRQANTSIIPVFTPEMEAFFASRSIPMWVPDAFLRSGDIELEAGRLVFCYNTGKKMRCDFSSSKANRWLNGSAEGALWRMKDALRKEVDTVIINEGETDLMLAYSYLWERPNVALVAAPAASWCPDPVMCQTIGRGRNVVLCFDNDNAGTIATGRVYEALQEHGSCESISRFPWSQVPSEGWKKENGNDLCDLRVDVLQETFNRIV